MLSNHTHLSTPDFPQAKPAPLPEEAVSFSPSSLNGILNGIVPCCLLGALLSAAVTLDKSTPGLPLPAPPSASPSASASTLVPRLEAPAAPPENVNNSIAELLRGHPTPSAVTQSSGTQPATAASPTLPLASKNSALPPGLNAPKDSPGKAAFDQGESALRQAKIQEAKRAFQQALALDNNLAPAHLRLAALSAEGNDAPQAQFHLEAAAHLLPKDATPRLQLSQLYMQLRQPQKAEVAAQNAVQVATGPLRREAQGHYARILAANKKDSEAYAIWAALAKANPNDAEATLAASVIADEKLRRPQDAAKLLAQAVKAPPQSPEVSLLLAEVLASKKRLKDALKVLSLASKKFSTYIPLHLALAQLKLASGDAKGSVSTLRTLLAKVPAKIAGGSAKAEVYVALAQVLTRSGQTKTAISEAKNALKLQPRNPAVAATVAELFLACGDFQNGIAALKTLIQLDPRNKKAHHVLAGAYADTQKWDLAQQELDIYIKAQPQDLNALVDRAGLLERRGQKAEALKVWATLAQKKPDVPLAPLQQGRLSEEMGKLEPALAHYRTVLKLVPNQPNALWGMAKIEEKQGDASAALKHLKLLVGVEPKADDAYSAMLRLAKKQNQTEATVAFLKEQLAKNPDRRGAYTAILEYYESGGKTEVGRSFVKGYIDKNPKLAAPRLAIDEFDLRRAKSSLADLLKADKTNLQNPVSSKQTEPKNEADKPLLRERGSTLPAPTQ